MKLYDVPKNSKIRIYYQNLNEKLFQDYTFHHIDGAYSYCTDSNNNIIHIGASTEVEIINENI
jgi:hypothetical protein